MGSNFVPQRIESLYSADPQVRARATEALPSWTMIAEARQWARFMLEDQEYAVREAAARALGEIGVALDVKLLRDLAAVDDLDVAVQAIDSIRRIEERADRLRDAA